MPVAEGATTTSRSSSIAYALDYATLDEARAGALSIRDSVGMLKIGLELFVLAGPSSLAIGREAGLPVFLDLKLHDIPETVERAVAQASTLGAKLLTVHAGGGAAMLRRAVARASTEGGGLTIVAVTVLTSLDAGDLLRAGISGDVASHARRLARIAFDEGVRAFVCSPSELTAMRAELGHEAQLFTPGVRPSGGATHDQKRTATPGQAIRDGADWIVVGRPIRDANDPRRAAQAINEEVAAARRSA